MRTRVYDVCEGQDRLIESDGLDAAGVGIRVSVPAGMSYTIAIEQLRQVARALKASHQKPVEAAAESARLAVERLGPPAADVPPEHNLGDCPRCKAELEIKHGKHGPFVSCSAWPECTFKKPTPAAVAAVAPAKAGPKAARPTPSERRRG